MAEYSPSEHKMVETMVPSILAPPSPPSYSSTITTSSSLDLAPTLTPQPTDDNHLDPKNPPIGESAQLDGEEPATQLLPITSLDPTSSDALFNLTPSTEATTMSTVTNLISNADPSNPSCVNDPPKTELASISIVPMNEDHTVDSNETTKTHTTDMQQRAGPLASSGLKNDERTDRGLDCTSTITSPLKNQQITHTPFGQRDQINSEEAGPSSLAQLLSLPTSLTEPGATTTTTTTTTTTSTVVDPSGTEEGQGSGPPSKRPLLRPLSLPPRFSYQAPMFTSADEPPAYSPTHTILPHYFSLEPIPVRTYIIKDSAGLPFLHDFWLISTTQSVSPASSRPQSILVQERGLSPQHHAEIKYSIIRPHHTDRTALPITGPGATNAFFIPALALVAANYPSRWVWWGTEALQMVVFGRQLKNVIMEWRWKHVRVRTGGPIVHRLIGCSFQIAPDRRFCWKVGSGKRRTTTVQQARNSVQQRQGQQRAHISGSMSTNPSSGNTNNDGTTSTVMIRQVDRNAGGGGWFGSFFGKASRHRASDTEASPAATGDIALDSVRVHTPSINPEPAATQESVSLSEQEAAVDSAIDASAEGDEDDEEARCYHCREESSTGFLGRIVAVYKPGRPADRARDRPASSRKLEVFVEVGERCETAMMLMCMRLDDLFMSIPAQKKEPFVKSSSSRTGGSSSSGGGDGTANGQQPIAVSVDRNNSRDEHGQVNEGAGGGRRGGGGGDSRMGEQGRRPSLVLLKKRLVGTRHDWLFRLRWIVAAILIAVVLVLVLGPRLSN